MPFVSPLGAILLMTVLAACERPQEAEQRREVLQEKEPLGTVGVPRDGYEDLDRERQLPPPVRFERAKFHLSSESDLTARVHVEEVTAGLRIAVSIREAKPGSYGLVVHESGSCSADPETPLGPALDLGTIEQANDRSDLSRYALGKFEVPEDGSTEPLFLTAWGNLNEGDGKSLLGRPLALYEVTNGGKLGHRVACSAIKPG